MSTFSIGGLSTGLDTKSIISQLISIDSAPKTKLEWNKALWQARRDGWSDLNTRLLSLQTMSNAIMNPKTWDQTAATSTNPYTALSSDPSRVKSTLTNPNPTASATYQVEVQQLARGEISQSSGSLSGPGSATQTGGAFRRSASAPALASTRVRSLRSETGASMGLNTGSKITMSFAVNGGPTQNAVFNVTSTNTLNDLTTWAAAQAGPGSTATVTPSGQIQVTTAPGSANALTSMSFTAVNSVGTNLTAFNASAGASSTTTTPAFDGGVMANDTLTITQGANTWNVAILKGDAMSDIAAKINAVSGIGISATVNAGVLQISSLTQGAASAFAITSAGSTATDLALNETQTAQDARYTVNGTSYTNASNYGATAGLTDISIDLFQTTMAPATITVGQGAPGGPSAQDTWVNATKKKIADFVNQYNSVLDFVSAKSGEQKVINPKNLGDYLAGPLSRDYQFSSVGFDLQKQVGNVVSGLPQGGAMLSDIGITTSFTMGTGTANKLVIDDAVLDAALRADPQKVRDILGKVGAGDGITADDGIVRRVSELVSNLRTGGKVDSALQGMSTQMSSLQSSIDKFTMRLASKQTYYERMFASMETTIGKMQSQMSSLSGTFASLTNG